MPPVARITALRLEDMEPTELALVAEGADHPLTVLEQRDHGDFHVEFDPLVDGVILQGADHLETGAVADVRQARVAMAAEVALVGCDRPGCDRTPPPTPRAR